MWIGLVIPAVANYGGNASELGGARGGGGAMGRVLFSY